VQQTQMRDDESTHFLETSKTNVNVSAANMNEGEQKHALPIDKEAKGGVTMVKTNEGG
jgi:hypothetical protein